AQRRDPSLAAEQALHFGSPILTSGLTLIEDDCFYYRGQDALQLARSRTVEEVASFLWSDDWSPITLPELPDPLQAEEPRVAPLSPLVRFQLGLALAEATDLAGYDFRPQAVRATGARILSLLTTIASGTSMDGTLVSTLLGGWRIGLDGAERLLSAALILCADHELNVSSFTARCVASAGSSPYQVVLAGLAALQGSKHGGLTARTASFLQEVGEPRRARASVGEKLKRGEAIPGFGHPLYVNGDPRARLLLHLMHEAAPDSPALLLAQAIRRQTIELVGLAPTIDFALATLARLLGRPREDGLTIFALGRTIGWMGHALEQYQLGTIIRPRARYEGPLPHTAID
ncbi:MAG TPA: citrate synthase, partial [Candidatus Binatia bacterium]|nr:citrate synthase [Candidatus Binatia bacterium]